ncbi:MAG: hypothetical protein J6T08_05045 [Lentisphaeria bacterium]|nr:hypothetical protein [Lentisphaeria bacterium]
MTCKECPFYYCDDLESAPFGDNIPYCHYPDDDPWKAPCEYEEEEASDEPSDWMDEVGFDPYEGCYTYDC